MEREQARATSTTALALLVLTLGVAPLVAFACRGCARAPDAGSTAISTDAGPPSPRASGPPDPFQDLATPFALAAVAAGSVGFTDDPPAAPDRARSWPRVDHLDLAYMLPLQFLEATHVAGNAIALGGDAPWLADVRTGARSHEVPTWPKEWLGNGDSFRGHAAPPAAELLLHQERGSIHAYDPRTVQRRFARQLYTDAELARRATAKPPKSEPNLTMPARTGSVLVLHPAGRASRAGCASTSRSRRRRAASSGAARPTGVAAASSLRADAWCLPYRPGSCASTNMVEAPRRRASAWADPTSVFAHCRARPRDIAADPGVPLCQWSSET